jgi:hypothetical protein
MRTRPSSCRPYNPATHGLPAKAWECLRRNSDFKAVIDAARSSREETQEQAHIAWLEAMLAVNQPAHFLLGRFNEPFNLAQPWPEFPAQFKAEFERFFSTERKHSFGDDFASFSGGGSLPYVVDSIPEGADIIAPMGHTSVAIPNHIRDPRHRAAVIRSLIKLVRKPSAGDVRATANNGRVLGTEAEWRSFLLAEQWQESAGFLPGKAANLAAWEIYGGQTFGGSGKARTTAADRFLTENPKSHKRKSKVEEQVRAIETAIHSVYPDFAPFGAASTSAR